MKFEIENLDSELREAIELAAKYLDELIDSEVPEQWQDYIDRDAWFEAHDAFTFEEILERMFDHVNFEGEFNGYEFYEVEGEEDV